MAKIQPLINPALIRIIDRFPESQNAICNLFRTIPSFNEISMDHEQCCKTLEHYQLQDSDEARLRTSEYGEILQGLELEIMQYLNDYDDKLHNESTG
jgi:hypothetical protein